MVCAVAILGATFPYLSLVANALFGKCETVFNCFFLPAADAAVMCLFYPHLFLALLVAVVVLCVPKSWPAKPIVTMAIAICSIAASLIYVESMFS